MDDNTQKISSFFHSHPVFSRDEFVAFKAANGVVKQNVIKQALHYYVKNEHLIIVRRGLYAYVPPNESVKNTLLDPYLIAGKVTKDSVLSHHTALELHGVAYSIFNIFTFITKYKIKPFSYQDRFFQPFVTAANKNIKKFGVDSVDRLGVKINLTCLERTFVDVLDRPDLSGGWEEVCRSIEKMAALDLDKLIAYCLKLGNATTVAKVGYFLERRRGAFAPTAYQIKKLIAKKPNWAQYLNKKSTEKHHLVKKWNLIVPYSVLSSKWEEPNHDV